MEPYGPMRHGDLIGIGAPKKLGHLLLGPYWRFIYTLELEQIKVCKARIGRLWLL